jgi:hypothetical protein
MQVLPKYRLELHWESVVYHQTEVATLKGAYFSGSALKDAEKLRDEDQLILDMTQQHWVFVPMQDFYQATLYWKGVEYRGDRIYLKEARLQGKYVNSIVPLKNDNWILIDCKEHDSKKMTVGKRGKKLAPGVYQTIYTHTIPYWAEIMKGTGEEKF